MDNQIAKYLKEMGKLEKMLRPSELSVSTMAKTFEVNIPTIPSSPVKQAFETLVEKIAEFEKITQRKKQLAAYWPLLASRYTCKFDGSADPGNYLHGRDIGRRQ